RKRLPGSLVPERINYETPASYIHRLERHLRLAGGTLRRVARTRVATKKAAAIREEVHMLTEELVGLAPGELAAVWEAPLYGENMLHAVCEACTGGQSVELAAHYESFVCHEHHRWLGIYEGRPQNELRNFQYPGEPSGARLATDDVLRADIKYQALLSQGRISPTLLKECLSLVMGYPEEGTSLTPTPEAFPTLVNLLELVTDEELLKDLLNPGLTFAEARQLLEILLHRRGMKFSANVIDNIWIYLRPHFFATR